MWEDATELPSDVRATVQQAIRTVRETLKPYLGQFSAEELTELRRIAEAPGPRAVPLPAANSDLGRLHDQLSGMCEKMEPHQFLDDLRAELQELVLMLEGTLIRYGAQQHDVEPGLQRSIRLIMAN